MPELVFHGASQTGIFDQDVQLVVTQEAGRIEVAGADPNPTIVCHDGLGMQHWTVPLVDPDPAPEQITVPDSGEISYQGNVTRPRDQQADIDTVAS